MEFTFQTGTLRQGVKRLMIVVQGFETLLDLIEVHGLQAAAHRRGGQNRIQGRHIAGQLVLGFQNVVKLGGQHRPTTVRHEHVPLFRLLGHHLQGIMQVLHLCADT